MLDRELAALMREAPNPRGTDRQLWFGHLPTGDEFICCHGKSATRLGGDSLATSPAPDVYHSRACPLRLADGTLPARAPRTDVTTLAADAVTMLRTERRRRAASAEWQRDRRRSEVADLADKGLGGRRIARALGLRLRTVSNDLAWLREHGGWTPLADRIAWGLARAGGPPRRGDV